MAMRVLLVSGRTEIEDVLLDDPGASTYRLERRPPHMVDPAECARDFPIILLDAETTPDAVTLGRALRAANRAVEWVLLVGAEAERLGVEALKHGAFDYLLWPPTEAADLWTLIARVLRKLTPPEPEPFPRQFGKYKLLRKLGEGGMAEIFLAEQLATPTSAPRQVVVKRLHDNLASGEEFVKMFADEARISSMLVHPNIVRVFDFGRVDTAIYLAMEFIPGQNLEELARSVGGPLPPAIACYIVAEVCAGLGHAHSKTDKSGMPLNIVHRDVNPPNVLIADDGRVMLTDFGIAKAAHRYYETTSGVLKGKFEYMSPEQANGKPVDRRTDLFCAGLVLFELLCGQRPFQAGTPIETLFLIQQCNLEPPSKLNPRIPAVLDRIVMMALAKNPDQRYQEAGELERHLREFARRTTNPGPRDLATFAKGAARQAALTDQEPTSSLGSDGATPEAPIAEPTVPPVSRPRTPGRPNNDAVPTMAGPTPTGIPSLERTETRDAPVPVAPLQERTESRDAPTPIAPPPFVNAVKPPPRPSSAGLKPAVPPPKPAAAEGAREGSFVDLRQLLADDITRSDEKQLPPEPPAPMAIASPPPASSSGVPLALPEIAEPPPKPNFEATVIRNLGELPRSAPVPQAAPREETAVEARRPSPTGGSGELFSPEAKRAAAVQRQLMIAAGVGIGLVLLAIIVWAGRGVLFPPVATPIAVSSIPPMPSATEAKATPLIAVRPSSPPPVATTALVDATPRPTPPTTVAIARATPRPTASPLSLAALPTIALPGPTPTPPPRPVAKGGLSVWVDTWATVYVDGAKLPSPAPFADQPVAAGKHRVILENAKHERREYDVTIAPGKSTVVNGAFQ